ncbi:hypothetical protein ACFLTE_05980 [Bacteroidota bacterium]
MKKSNAIVTLLLFLLSFSFNVIAQEEYQQKSEILDIKLKLLDSKLELMESNIEMWESKPDYINQQLFEIEKRIDQLYFDPAYINYKIQHFDSVIQNQNKQVKNEKMKKYIPLYGDTIIIKKINTVISLNPVRIGEGSMSISYERILNDKFSFDITGIATYATNEGVSEFYMKNQKMEYFSDVSNTYIPYNPENISGYGLILEFRNYLLADVYPKYTAPKGLYVGPQLMFRRVWISGNESVPIEVNDQNFPDWEIKEITNILNIYAGGVIIGTKFSLIKVLAVDFHIGGIIRLSQYNGDNKFTKYKKVSNIDYSGVMPTMGFKLGILK